jgi:hypothetical protein
MIPPIPNLKPEPAPSLGPPKIGSKFKPAKKLKFKKNP